MSTAETTPATATEARKFPWPAVQSSVKEEGGFFFGDGPWKLAKIGTKFSHLQGNISLRRRSNIEENYRSIFPELAEAEQEVEQSEPVQALKNLRERLVKQDELVATLTEAVADIQRRFDEAAGNPESDMVSFAGELSAAEMQLRDEMDIAKKIRLAAASQWRAAQLHINQIEARYRDNVVSRSMREKERLLVEIVDAVSDKLDALLALGHRIDRPFGLKSANKLLGEQIATVKANQSQPMPVSGGLVD